MFDETLLRDCRTIETWRDYQHGIRASFCRSSDLIDRAASTLLSSTNDECLVACDYTTRLFNNVVVLLFVEVYALSGRTKHDNTGNAGLDPCCDISAKCFEIDVLTGVERCGGG